MTIRKRLLGTGLIAVAGLLIQLIMILSLYIKDYKVQAKAHLSLESFFGWANVVHELQRERGLTAGFLVASQNFSTNRLDYAFKQTDRAIEALPSSEMKFAQLLKSSLIKLRRQILDQTITQPGAVTQLSLVINEIQTHLAAEPSLRTQRHDFTALLRLSQIKEFCGKIRAFLYGRLLLTQNGLIDTSQAIELVVPSSYFVNSLTNRVTPEIHQILKAESLLPKVQGFFDSVNKIDLRHPGLAPEEWFKKASEMIEDLHATEAEMMAKLAQVGARELDQTTRSITLAIIISIVLVSGIIVLTSLTVRVIFKSLDSLQGLLLAASNTHDLSHLEKGLVPASDFNRILKSLGLLANSMQTVINEKEARATTDSLTGLANRLYFNEHLEIETGRRFHKPSPLSLIIADIDHFKLVNDTFGHQVGDQVLKTFALTLKQHVRRTDLVARWGGEEFTILLPETPLEDARLLAEKLRQAVESLNFRIVGRLTASFGVTAYIGYDRPDALVSRADQALYRAKESGRNRVCVLEPKKNLGQA